MRDILFRGKNVETGEWEYGLYIKMRNHVSSVSCIRNENFENFRVYENSVGQFTGLFDKNGQRIFEGDICDFTVFDCFDNDTQYKGVVVYSGSRFMLWKSINSEYYGADGGFDLDWVVDQYDEFEVIGNIFDNPELLENNRATS